LRRKRHRHSRAKAKQSDPGYADRSKVWLAGRTAPDRHPGCPGAPTSKSPGAFNAHNPGDGGSGLVQPVFRSPARIPAAESTQRTVRRAAKRKTLYVIKNNSLCARAGSPEEKFADPIRLRNEIADGQCSGPSSVSFASWPTGVGDAPPNRKRRRDDPRIDSGLPTTPMPRSGLLRRGKTSGM
jgi:hypothetical protein